jgi:DNA repair protein RecO (recombination protein O)
MSTESRKLAAQMLTAPLSKLRASSLPDSTGTDLRKFLLQTLERHIEKKLVTRGMLDRVAK